MPRRTSVLCISGLFGCLLCVAGAAFADEPRWERVTIDSVFRSEGVGAADINKDGKVDIIHGEAWYEAPDWTMHPIRPLGDYKDGATTYSPTFATWAYDVNGDGWADLVCVGFPGKPFHWFENPQNKPGDWKQHEIWHSACNESPQFLDVTGDGRPELVLGSQPEGQVGYLEIPSGEKVYAKWNFVGVSQPTSPDSQDKSPPPGTAPFYHGLGVGDVNGDGRNDIVIPHGWWEQPAKGKAGSGPWEFHPWNLTVDGKPGYLPAAHMFLDDLDLDGDQDVIMSSAHQVGVWWFENAGPGNDPQFKYHLISDAVTQTHAAQYVDLNGDGTKDLVTGKRWWAHGPKGDVRPDDDPIVVWFEIQKVRGEAPKFIPHVIGESSGTGVGTQFLVFDVNGDKRPDIVLSNKRGTNLLRQTGGNQKARH